MTKEIGAFSISDLRKVAWNKMFYMFYIEPVVLVMVSAHSLSATVLRNQVIYQACVEVFAYNKSDCIELGTKDVSADIKAIETNVQPYAANLLMTRTLLESIVPAICGLFIGSWSDYYGRKPLLLISMIGFSLTYLILSVICELSAHYPVNPWYYVVAALPHSILGGTCVFSVAVYCFISDVTTTTSRPYRMIFLEVFFFVGLTSGSLLSSYLYAATNATTVLALSAILMCLTTMFIALFVPESLHEDLATHSQATNVAMENAKGDTDAVRKETNTEVKQRPDGSHEKAVRLFSFIHIKEMLVTCFKKRPVYDRCIIWLITGTMFLAMFVMDGATTVLYLFVREKFRWSVRDFTIFESVSPMVTMFGALIGFLLLRKLLKLSVVALALLAIVSSILSNVVVGFAELSWHLYLSVVLGAFSSISAPMCRTIVSNIVPATDLGKIFSIKNVLQSIAPFIASPLYTYIYKSSLATFPGLFSIVSAALHSTSFVFLAIVLYLKHVYPEQYAKILK